MHFLINWLIALGAVALLFAGIYILVKLAVKKAMWEILQEMAKKVWEEDDKA